MQGDRELRAFVHYAYIGLYVFALTRDHVCLHADSPYYAKKYGLVKREREKYERILDTANASLYKAD